MEGTPFGRYELVEVLGRGGMGEVWRAFDTITERTVAVKVLPAHLAGDEGFQKRFLREAKAAASLNEPHVVPIYDFGEADGRLFVAMRLVDGHDLQALLADGPLSPERAVTIVEQVASALQAAHGIGLVHRDIKPSNILVGDDDFAYLIDFGIARVAGETGLTSTGMTLGTWPYMAPERFRSGTVDARADVYALACVLHQALTGQQPFPGESLEQIATGHMFDPPPRPSAIQSSVPAAMDNVIAIGMAKDPDERYTTTKDLAQGARAALPAPIGHATIVAAGAQTLAAPLPELNDAPTQYAPTEPATTAATLASTASPPSATSWYPTKTTWTTFGAIAAGLLVVITLIALANSSNNGSPRSTHSAGSPPLTTSTTRSTTTTTQASPIADPQQRLLAILPSEATCSESGPNNGAIVEMSCQMTGAVTRASFRVYRDAAGMNKEFNLQANSGYKNYTALPCPGMDRTPQYWSRLKTPNESVGKVGCGTVDWKTPPVPYLAFSIDSDLIVGYVQGAGGENLDAPYRWWSAHYQ